MGWEAMHMDHDGTGLARPGWQREGQARDHMSYPRRLSHNTNAQGGRARDLVWPAWPPQVGSLTVVHVERGISVHTAKRWENPLQCNRSGPGLYQVAYSLGRTKLVAWHAVVLVACVCCCPLAQPMQLDR